MSSPFFWLFLNLITLIILSFYSMLEMACVSFNKVRLQYYVSKGIKQAVWLNYLLHNPSRLFGTTLIMVDMAMFAGSECAREFHQAIGLSPDLAPLSQVILVVIFGELAPMFAARRYAEHVAMLGVPLVYLTAKLMTPFLILLGWISKLCNLIIGGNESLTKIFLSREELLQIIESQDEDKGFTAENEEFNTIAINILNLHKKDARAVMSPLKGMTSIPSSATTHQARALFQKSNANYLPMYHNQLSNIIGILFPRNLIRVADNKRAREFIQPAWFITQHTKVSQILHQFRHNNQSAAVVLDNKGLGVGLINLDDIMEEIFGETRHPIAENKKTKLQNILILDRTLPGDMHIGEFNSLYGVNLDSREDLTLSELITEKLGHHPEVDETIYIDPFEITVKETSLLDIKSVSVSTKRH